jgi:hypothetical protein
MSTRTQKRRIGSNKIDTLIILHQLLLIQRYKISRCQIIDYKLLTEKKTVITA